MSISAYLRCALVVLISVAAACGHDAVGPSREPAAHIDAVSDLTRTAVVGAAIPGALTVRVTDASGRPVVDATVAFAVTAGNGSTNPRVAVTDSHGQASTAWTLGTIVGPNEVTASVTGVTSPVKFSADGAAGPVTTITLTPRDPRLLVGTDSTRVTAQSLDAFGNQTSPAPVFTVRDPTLVSVDANGVVRALKRGASTYIVATAGEKSDSVLITVLAVGQSICTAVATPVELVVGQVVTDASGAGACVHAATAGAEYALIPFYNSGVSSATLQIDVRGQGLTPLLVPTTTITTGVPSALRSNALIPDDGFEARLRARERAGSAVRAGHAEAPAARRDIVGSTAALAVPALGDFVKYNVNSQDFCDRPDIRTGRVAAISDRAIIVADTANPEGGFTDEEYRSIGVTFDTLVDPVDRGAFGSPSDIDNNGHVIIFFTRAVNELTSSGSGGVVLGYYYRRDLYPKTTSPTETCVGSNVAEIMYMLVPDTGGVVNGNERSKAQVITASNGTVAHEYQHMINASRRKYVNNVGEVFEERWLDEGLAHIAEDLNFWRASGLSPRSNVDASVFTNPKLSAAYSTFANNNFLRYRTYLQRTELQSPIGFDVLDDDLQTRGAIWSFLRYAADRQPGGTENAFWTKLVNSNTSGIANLTKVLGTTPYGLLRDWAISVFMDDNAPGVDPRFQQPSWNVRSVMTNNGTSLAFPLLTHVLADNTAQRVLLAGNGVAFFRFSVPAGSDALLIVTAGGQPLPSTMQLAVVRVK